MFVPKNDFAAYSEGFDPSKTHLSVDAHGMMKGARNRPNENYLGPRIGSYGPDWTKDIPLPDNYHFVLEYFFLYAITCQRRSRSILALVGS